jgi:hypothetical protein
MKLTMAPIVAVIKIRMINVKDKVLMPAGFSMDCWFSKMGTLRLFVA